MEEGGDCPACGVNCSPINIGSIRPERMVRALLDVLPGLGDPSLEHLRMTRMRKAAEGWLLSRQYGTSAVTLTVSSADVESELGLCSAYADEFMAQHRCLIQAAMWDAARDTMRAFQR